MKLLEVLGLQRSKVPGNVKRSGHWPFVRQVHLDHNPTCACCGGIKKIEVHHISPFHLDPDKELDFSNLITLCEDNSNGIDCHLAMGHLGSFKSWNVDVVKDAAAWLLKLTTRPTVET